MPTETGRLLSQLRCRIWTYLRNQVEDDLISLVRLGWPIDRPSVVHFASDRTISPRSLSDFSGNWAGIPDHQAERVNGLDISPFIGSSSRNARNRGGLGLGLYIANAIVVGFGGTLEGDRIGDDAQFTIVLNEGYEGVGETPLG
jgi:hypothetical protein